MKTLLILFTVISLVICAAALCPFGCACSNDDPCDYYCDGGQCQSVIPYGNTCSGYYYHPRECGAGSYCDPNYLTCAFKKSYGESCSDDYVCSTSYCDLVSGTCLYSAINISWQLYFLLPGLVTVTIVSLIIVLVFRRRRLYTRAIAVQSSSQSQFSNAGMREQMPPPYVGFGQGQSQSQSQMQGQF